MSRPISIGIGPSNLLFQRILRRRGSVALRAGRWRRGGDSQLCRGLGIVGLAEDRDRQADRLGLRLGLRLVLGLAVAVVAVVLADLARRAVPEIAALLRAARRDEAGIASLGVAVPRDVAGFDRERAGDLVVLEPPATPRAGRAAARA